MSFCSFDSTFFGQRVNVQTSLEFLRGSRIQLSCQYLCPSSRARLLLLIRGIAIQLFSLAIPSQYRRLEYHPIPIRCNISTLFCSVECYKSINQVMLHNNQNLRSSPVLPNSLFFVRWNLCTTSFATSFSDFDEKDANHGRHRSYSSICVSTLCFLGWYRIGLISNVTTRSGHPHFLSLTESLF